MRLLIVFLLIFFSACFYKSQEYLKIGTNVWPGYEPLYLARELGLLAKEIHIIESSSSSQVIRLYRNKSINSAALTLDEVLLLRSYGLKPVIILVTDISNGADVLITKPYIHNLKDLKGKKIGVENTALGAYMLERILDISGLKRSDIEIVPLEINEHLNAFKKGIVDAVITFEPVKSKLLQIGGKVLFDSSQIPNEIVDVLVVEEEFLEKNKKIVLNLVNGWFKALDFFKKNNKKAIEIMADRENVSVNVFKNALNGIIIPDVNLNKQLLDNNNPLLIPVIVRLQKIMKKKGLIKNKVDISHIIDERFINAIK